MSRETAGLGCGLGDRELAWKDDDAATPRKQGAVT